MFGQESKTESLSENAVPEAELVTSKAKKAKMNG